MVLTNAESRRERKVEELVNLSSYEYTVYYVI